MKQKFIEWFIKNNNGCLLVMEDDRSFVYEMMQYMFEVYQVGVVEGEVRCVMLVVELCVVEVIYDEVVFIIDDYYEQCLLEVQKMICLFVVLQIFVYQVFLIEVCVQGVDEFLRGS